MFHHQKTPRILSQIIVLAYIITLSLNAGFTSEIPVYTSSTYTPISELKTGDDIVSYDQIGECVLCKVNHITSYITHNLVSITCDNTTVYTDPQQQFFTLEDQTWKSASQLSIGDTLYRGDGTHTVIREIQSVPGAHRVYAIMVTHSHNFYATHEAVLVHNDYILATTASTIFGSLSASPASVTIAVHPAVAGGAAIGALSYVTYTLFSGKTDDAKNQCNDQRQSYHNDTCSQNNTQAQNISQDAYQASNTNHVDIIAHDATHERKRKDSNTKNTSSQPVVSAAGGGAGDPDGPRGPWRGNNNNIGNIPPSDEIKNQNKREKVLPKEKSYERARNKALEIIDDVHDTTSAPFYGKFGAGRGKVVGRSWHEERVIMRVDWDPIKGPHINIEDWRYGKGANGRCFVIPFDGNEQTVRAIIESLQK